MWVSSQPKSWGQWPQSPLDCPAAQDPSDHLKALGLSRPEIECFQLIIFSGFYFFSHSGFFSQNKNSILSYTSGKSHRFCLLAAFPTAKLLAGAQLIQEAFRIQSFHFSCTSCSTVVKRFPELLPKNTCTPAHWSWSSAFAFLIFGFLVNYWNSCLSCSCQVRLRFI